MLATFLSTFTPRRYRYASQAHPLGRMVQAMLLTPNLYYAPFIRHAVNTAFRNNDQTNSVFHNWQSAMGGDVNALLPLVQALHNSPIPHNPHHMGWGMLQPHINNFQQYLSPANAHIHAAFTPGSFVDGLVNEHTLKNLPPVSRLMSLMGGYPTPAMKLAVARLYGSGSLDALHGVYRQTLHDLGGWGPHGPAGDVLGQLYQPTEEAITHRIGAAQASQHATGGTHTRPNESVPEDYYAL